MASDVEILKIMLDANTYDKYAEHLNKAALSDETVKLLTDFKVYRTTTAGNVNLEEFKLWFFHVQHSDLPKTQVQFYNSIFQRMVDAEELPVDQVVRYCELAAIRNKMDDVLLHNKDISIIRELIDRYEQLGASTEENEFASNKWEDIIARCPPNDGLLWRSQYLQNVFGSLTKGHYLIMAALEYTGKSMLCINEVTHMASRLEEGRIMWLTNEEPPDFVQKKLRRAVLNASLELINQHPLQADKQYINIMHGDLDRILVKDIGNSTIADIVRLAYRYEPKLIVLDMPDKLIGDSQNAPWALGVLHQKIKQLANEVCPIISTSHVTKPNIKTDEVTGEFIYPKYWDLHSMADSSKKAKVADAVLTLGRESDGNPDRFLYPAKNRLNPISDGWLNKRGVLTMVADKCRFTEPTQDFIIEEVA